MPTLLGRAERRPRRESALLELSPDARPLLHHDVRYSDSAHLPLGSFSHGPTRSSIGLADKVDPASSQERGRESDGQRCGTRSPFRLRNLVLELDGGEDTRTTGADNRTQHGHTRESEVVDEHGSIDQIAARRQVQMQD